MLSLCVRVFMLPDFTGNRGQRHVHAHGIVSDSKHSHAQALIFYIMLLRLRLACSQWNHPGLKVMLALHSKHKFIFRKKGI